MFLVSPLASLLETARGALFPVRTPDLRRASILHRRPSADCDNRCICRTTVSFVAAFSADLHVAATQTNAVAFAPTLEAELETGGEEASCELGASLELHQADDEFETARAHCFATKPQQASPPPMPAYLPDVLRACFVILLWFPVSCVCTLPSHNHNRFTPIAPTA